MAVAENAPAPTAFPLDALPSAAAEYVSQLAATGLPVDFLGMAALGALAGAVGGQATLRIDAGWEERAIIWLAIVGDPGSQKSPAIGAVRGPLDAVQARLSKDYGDDVALYDELPAKAPELCLHHDTVLVHRPRALSNHYVSGGVHPPVSTPALFGGHGLANAHPPVRGAVGHDHIEGLALSCAPGHPQSCCLATGTVAGGLKHLKRFQSLGGDLLCPRRTLR
jgi:hypothetical protein